VIVIRTARQLSGICMSDGLSCLAASRRLPVVRYQLPVWRCGSHPAATSLRDIAWPMDDLAAPLLLGRMH
jgi:hypothetical protein